MKKYKRKYSYLWEDWRWFPTGRESPPWANPDSSARSLPSRRLVEGSNSIGRRAAKKRWLCLPCSTWSAPCRAAVCVAIASGGGSRRSGGNRGRPVGNSPWTGCRGPVRRRRIRRRRRGWWQVWRATRASTRLSQSNPLRCSCRPCCRRRRRRNCSTTIFRSAPIEARSCCSGCRWCCGRSTRPPPLRPSSKGLLKRRPLSLPERIHLGRERVPAAARSVLDRPAGPKRSNCYWERKVRRSREGRARRKQSGRRRRRLPAAAGTERSSRGRPASRRMRLNPNCARPTDCGSAEWPPSTSRNWGRTAGRAATNWMPASRERWGCVWGATSSRPTGCRRARKRALLNPSTGDGQPPSTECSRTESSSLQPTLCASPANERETKEKNVIDTTFLKFPSLLLRRICARLPPSIFGLHFDRNPTYLSIRTPQSKAATR